MQIGRLQYVEKNWFIGIARALSSEICQETSEVV